LPGGQSRGTPRGHVVVVVGTLVEVVVVADTGGRVATVVGVAVDGLRDEGFRVVAGRRDPAAGCDVGVATGVSGPAGSSGRRADESSTGRFDAAEPEFAEVSNRTRSYTSRYLVTTFGFSPAPASSALVVLAFDADPKPSTETPPKTAAPTVALASMTVADAATANAIRRSTRAPPPAPNSSTRPPKPSEFRRSNSSDHARS
jgi:hypothetical protein